MQLNFIHKSLLLSLFVLFITACEGGSDHRTIPPTTTTTTTTTTTSRTDDLLFTSSATVSVSENQLEAITLVATGGNGDNLTYYIKGTDEAYFNLDDSSGVVSFKVSPDYETKSLYNFETTVTDGNTTVSQDVRITIIDVADVVPEITDFVGTINENLPVGALVGTLNLISSGDSRISAYTLSDTSNFSISSSGAITTNKIFDYETQKSYSLSVYATNTAGNSLSVDVNISINDIHEKLKTIPTLVVVMNWDNYSEDDASLWYNKFFNPNVNSVNQWFNEAMQGSLQISPVTESSGTANDGIIMVKMGKNHPGGYSSQTFRDVEIKNAITSAEVVNNVDFKALDLDDNGALNIKELQIIFIVAGDEQSGGGAIDHSIWAQQWAFPIWSAPKVDGIIVMQSSYSPLMAGTYARFGANHGNHKATIGIIAHEMGHSMLNLRDYYDNGGGAGLGWYDIMSGGSWAQKSGDLYAGATPTLYSAFNRIDTGIDVNLNEVNASQTLTIECSSNQFIKLVTKKANEYFLLECRDTAKANSDISFHRYDSDFTENRLFTMLYHVDTKKWDNNDDGVQTARHHYKVALVEKNTTLLMTSSNSTSADFDDVYLLGDKIANSRTNLYDGTSTGYSLEIRAHDYANRTMTIKITKN